MDQGFTFDFDYRTSIVYNVVNELTQELFLPKEIFFSARNSEIQNKKRKYT